MTFTLPSYVKTADCLNNAELLGKVGDDCEYRATDFDGLSDHDKLLRKLEIMQLRGKYQVAA